jgi:hypothetical protein
MISYEELNEQNHRITELSNVLHYLFTDRSMCDTGACCDLFYRYVDLVKEHIEVVDKEMYKDLLSSPDDKVSNVAKNFMSGSMEIKKILREFTHHWCPSARKKDSLHIKDHAKFLKDTDELFEIVLQRIQDETEHLYPLVRSLS